VAQLVRASACHAEGCGFKSHHPRHLDLTFFVWVINSAVECFFYKEEVGGSNPSLPTNKKPPSNLIERRGFFV
jgi:hypothetical protein